MAARGKIKPNKQKKRFGNRKAYVGGGKVQDMIVRLQLNSDWLVLSLPLSFFPPVDLGASCRHLGDVFSPSAAVHYCFIEEISAGRGWGGVLWEGVAVHILVTRTECPAVVLSCPKTSETPAV